MPLACRLGLPGEGTPAYNAVGVYFFFFTTLNLPLWHRVEGESQRNSGGIPFTLFSKSLQKVTVRFLTSVPHLQVHFIPMVQV